MEISESTSLRLPSTTTMQHAFKKAIETDRPILMDYWPGSLSGSVVIGVKEEDDEKLLVKSSTEYTSSIVKVFKVDTEYIILTENSIYLVSADIQTRAIA